jgi:prevent-host-death family protein
MSLADAEAQFSDVVKGVRTRHERVVVTVLGQPAVVVISPDDIDSMEETIAILRDPEVMAGLRESQEAIKRGETVSAAEMKEILRARRVRTA